MRLIVTRPQAQAIAAVRELREAGVDAQALPLIAIEGLVDEPVGKVGNAGKAVGEGGAAALAGSSGAASPSESDEASLSAGLRHARETLAQRRLVMFVSANAVAHFLTEPGRPSWPPATLAGSTGPGTTAALRQAGVPAACIREPAAGAERLDSEALWQQLRTLDWRGARALIVRGEGGRDWLADTLRAAGAEVEFVTAYRRVLPHLDGAQAALLAAAQADPAGHAWHFSSSEAVHNLPRLAPGARWQVAVALATHPRIAEAARAIGFGHVQVLAPGLAALLEAWQALQAGGPSPARDG